MHHTNPIPNFQTATAVSQLTTHTYHTHYHDSYCIGSVPHGGYVATTLIRAASLHFATTHASLQQPNLLTLHLEYLRRTSIGPALITIRDVKLGRSTSTVHVALTQPNVDKNRGEEVVGYLTYTNLAKQSGVGFDTNWRLYPPPRGLNSAQELDSGRGDGWQRVAELPFSSFRKASKRVRWAFPRPISSAAKDERKCAVYNAAEAARADEGGDGEVTGSEIKGYSDQWIAPATRTEAGEWERWTDDSLGFICDMFPQIVETFLIPDVYTPGTSQDALRQSPAARYWYPTLLMNIDVKKSLGAEGREWLFVRVQAKQIKGGRYDLDVVVLDDEGDLVAISHHVCFALPASRNLGARGGAMKKGKL